MRASAFMIDLLTWRGSCKQNGGLAKVEVARPPFVRPWGAEAPGTS